jgi:sugar transferase (PEP-CTERM/EpsH1 system associated)
MNVLMVLLSMPAPRTGASTRNYHLLRALAREHHVSVLVLSHGGEDVSDADIAAVEALVDSLRIVQIPYTRSKRARQLLSLARGTSHSVADCTSPLVQAALDDAFRRTNYDVVFFHSVLPAGYRLPPGTRVIVDQHNIEYELLRRTAAQEPLGPRKVYNWLESLHLEPIELRRCAQADAVLVTSERERRALLRRLPDQRIEVVPNGVDLEFFTRSCAPALAEVPPEVEAGPRIVFTGAMNYFPNADAAVAFAATTWPRIRAQVPDATWQIVGKDPLPAVRQLAELPGVTVTGSVPDVRPYLAGAAVAIAPLLVGGGTRLKILEAFAMGLPVVATSLGCEGLDVTPEEHLLVADSPEAFADATVRCLQDPQLCAVLAAAGHALAEAEYGWDRIGARLLNVMRALMVSEASGVTRVPAERPS